jgi:hypothetical protein
LFQPAYTQSAEANVLDSLAHLEALPVAPPVPTSDSASWLGQILSGDALVMFIESLIIIVMGCFFAYLFYKRSEKSSSEELKLASVALLVFASNGVFFIFSTLSLGGVIPKRLGDIIFRLSWQGSSLWFIFFSFIFALNFVRSRKSRDTYFLATLTIIFALLTTAYSVGFWQIDYVSPVGSMLHVIQFSHDHITLYVVTAHLVMWVGFFFYAAYKTYARSKQFKDKSARFAMRVLSGSYFLLSLMGVVGLLTFRNNISKFIYYSYTIAMLIIPLFFFSIQNVYKNGRSRRG